ncbi:MAG: hypothetical protein P1Q69_19295 [Candidatus Thorarchaeota archaeon]|nr:hypothetical protein [Candidatus Thorarchaeota archaeon]
MTPDYEIYKNYNPNAKREIVVEDYLFGSAQRLEQMLEFLGANKSEFLKTFIQEISKKLSVNAKSMNIGQFAELIEKQLQKLPLLKSHSPLGDLVFPFVLGELNLAEFTEKATVLHLESEKGENLLLYHALKIMVDLLGREEGIQLYKGFVDYRIKNSPPREVDDFRVARVSWIKGMADSGGYEFAIYDFDESKFLGRFDKCVVYDSLKDMEDAALGYYVTCYAGSTGCNLSDWCVRMRRTQTLFTADFCDELYWDRHVYNEPEQPSLDFTRKLVVE